MDWALAIHRNRDALLRVVASLFAVAGLVRGAALPEGTSLPRPVRCLVLRLLRPAEAAVRRLIVIVARDLSVSPRPQRPAPVAGSIPKGTGARQPAFALLDTLPGMRSARRRYLQGPGPRISVPGVIEPVFVAAPAPAPIDAARLCKRLFAVQRALETLPQQARRMARWQEKRRTATRRGRTRAMRPGRPPGHRKRPVHVVDTLLADCHALALMALVPPDTS